LQRLQQRGWIESEWRITENNRRAKYYRLTATGRRAVGTETDSWRRYVDAVELILRTVGGRRHGHREGTRRAPSGHAAPGDDGAGARRGDSLSYRARDREES